MGYAVRYGAELWEKRGDGQESTGQIVAEIWMFWNDCSWVSLRFFALAVGQFG